MNKLRGKYEVTINLDYPTTRILQEDIPKEWVDAFCPDCKSHCLVDEEKEFIHHRYPFCEWWLERSRDKSLMTAAVQEMIGKDGNIKRMLGNQR
jgi:hypothetical protein